VSFKAHPVAPPARSGWAALVSEQLPDFPWDSLEAYAAQARRHPDGIVDLSMGTPVDPTPQLVQEALRGAADAPGYPKTIGTPRLRAAFVGWLERFGVTGLSPENVLPTIGSKELVASLPSQLGLGPGDTVVTPELAYPTYEIGARLAGCSVVASDSTTGLGPARVSLIWINSPANPSGRILGVEHLRKVVAWGRERGTLVVSDECYLECAWESEAVSVLHPDVCGGSFDGVLAVHSLSKRSNLAGYRAGFVAGDPAVVAELHEVRRHCGLMVPAPIQAAATAALEDQSHVAEQAARYRTRRTVLRTALEAAGFRIDHSEGSLYLWASRDEPCWDSVAWLAERGVLVAPGEFYGPQGARHVRVALTASDERVAAGVARLAS
jgi:succinyldiaminopimelate transaminase